MLCTFLQTPCLILHYCPLVVGLVTVSCKWLPIKILHFYSVLLQAIIITINILEPVKCWLTGLEGGQNRSGPVCSKSLGC